VSDFQSAGYPDLAGIVHGYSFNFEIKRPGEHPSVIQTEIIRQMREAGGVACVIRNPEEALNVVYHTLRTRGRLRRSQRAWIATYAGRYN
jgi:hypothetical protein